MKRVMLFCTMIIALVVSCAKDDTTSVPSQNEAPTVVGAWRCTHSYVYHAYETTVYQDVTDGWLNNVLKFSDDGLYYENGEMKGTYYVQNDSVYFNKTASEAEFNYEYAIANLDNSNMTLSFIVEGYNMRMETTYEFKAY